MRPVNLMPPEDRGGSRAPLRTGVVPYVLLGALALGLLGIIVLALTSKQISDSKAEKETLEQELAVATARADSLRAFTDFRTIQEQRTATVSSLAQSRFDWERVMNELALVIPTDVWLIQLTGTVSPAVQIEGGATISIRDSVTGPALEIVGCAPSQDAVAGFMAALEDIDGVTRVGVASSAKTEDEAAQAATGGATTADTVDDCRTREFIDQFEIVVAFDEVPVPAGATTAPGVPPPASAAPADSQVADGQQQIEASQQSSAQQTAEAQQAANIVPGG